MFFLILRQIIFSIIFIVSVHYIYIFLKNNLTIPKTKDLVKKPSQNYKDIYNSLSGKKKNNDMINELNNYMNNIKKERKEPEIEKDTLLSANMSSTIGLVNDKETSDNEDEYQSEWLNERLAST